MALEKGSLYALFADILTLFILGFLNWVTEKKLNTQQRYSSLLLVLVVILLGTTFGLIGVILAPPLAVTIEILLRNYIPPDNTKMDHVELTGLQKRIQYLKAKLKEVDLAPETANLVKRLEKLLNRVQQLELQRDK